MGEHTSFNITYWHNGAYRVSIPNYGGGTVYTADHVARLTRENEAMRMALEPFAAVAEHDIGDSETNADIFRPMRVHNRARQLTVGDLRAAALSLKDSEDAQA